MDRVWSITAEGTAKEIVAAVEANKDIPGKANLALQSFVGKTKGKLQASGFVHDDGKVTINAIVTPA